MNWTPIRTIFGFLAGAGFLTFVVQFLGCTALPNGTYDCSLSTWLPPAWQAAAALALLVVGGLIKAFGGTGTVTQNLFSHHVPVVSPEKAGPGTVTEAQVKAP